MGKISVFYEVIKDCDVLADDIPHTKMQDLCLKYVKKGLWDMPIKDPDFPADVIYVRLILNNGKEDNLESLTTEDIDWSTKRFYLNDNSDFVPADGSVNCISCLELPCKSLEGLWESLYFEGNVKKRLLAYAEAAKALSDRDVDPAIIGYNRLILVHGPPGTGKTTLCRALAQKMAIKMNFEVTYLAEVNCHNLFSKWFSESVKLVQKLFSQIKSSAEDVYALVVVLIDEVESLTTARQAALNGNEPSDTIRVVNAVLTQLDSLRSYKNIFFLATSNLPEAIDPAFCDRADIVQYIGLPGENERKLILKSCVDELARTKAIDEEISGEDIWTAVKMTEGMSGRAMRKLPLLAFAEKRSDIGFWPSFLEACTRLKKEKDFFKK